MSNIVIVGSGPAGVSAALYAVRAGVQTTVLTKGSGALARAEKIENYYGFAQPVSGQELAGGAVREVSGVFGGLGVAGSTALARKLGAAVEGSRIVVDDKMQTTVPGLYAAGDCTGGLLQVAKAVYEGALAGTEAAKALRKG